MCCYTDPPPSQFVVTVMSAFNISSEGVSGGEVSAECCHSPSRGCILFAERINASSPISSITCSRNPFTCHAPILHFPRQTRVGVTNFSYSAWVPIPLGKYSNLADNDAAVLNLPYNLGGTMTTYGLQVALADFAAHARPQTQIVPRVLVVITDGGSNVCPTVGGQQVCYPGCGGCSSTIGVQLWSNAARANGVTLFAMGELVLPCLPSGLRVSCNDYPGMRN